MEDVLPLSLDLPHRDTGGNIPQGCLGLLGAAWYMTSSQKSQHPAHQAPAGPLLEGACPLGLPLPVP